MTRFAAIGTLGGLVLLVVAVRALFVGYPSFEPVLFAELYIWLFSVVAFGVMLQRTVRRTRGEHIFVLFLAALAGAVLVAQAAPTIGEPNYCGYFRDYPSGIDLRLPPKSFRCTSLPFEIAGWFGGWWLTLWLIMRWEERRGS